MIFANPYGSSITSILKLPVFRIVVRLATYPPLWIFFLVLLNADFKLFAFDFWLG